MDAAFPNGGLARACALTAHKADGVTMPTTGRGRRQHQPRPPACDAISCRRDSRAYLIHRRDLAAVLDNEDWLPLLDNPGGPVRSMLDHPA